MTNHAIFFEWDIETIDEHGDIQDHNFSDECPGIPEPGIPEEEGLRLVLVRDVFEWPSNDLQRKCDPDLTERLWAYVVDGKLPEFFEDCGKKTAVKVPVRFHKELLTRSA
jgi:hypothetical protein